MTRAPLRPSPVRSERPPTTLPMPAVKVVMPAAAPAAPAPRTAPAAVVADGRPSAPTAPPAIAATPLSAPKSSSKVYLVVIVALAFLGIAVAAVLRVMKG